MEAQSSDTGGIIGMLSIRIPGITAGASMGAPVTGVVEFSAPATENDPYNGEACNFYFSSPSEGVSAGRIWVTFDCPTVTDAESPSTCSIGTSVALFEGCATE